MRHRRTSPSFSRATTFVKLAPRLSVRPVQHSGTALVPRLRTVKCDELRILGKPWLGAQTPTASAHRLDALAE
jgi:hypothetical protein